MRRTRRPATRTAAGRRAACKMARGAPGLNAASGPTGGAGERGLGSSGAPSLSSMRPHSPLPGRARRQRRARGMTEAVLPPARWPPSAPVPSVISLCPSRCRSNHRTSSPRRCQPHPTLPCSPTHSPTRTRARSSSARGGRRSTACGSSRSTARAGGGVPRRCSGTAPPSPSHSRPRRRRAAWARRASSRPRGIAARSPPHPSPPASDSSCTSGPWTTRPRSGSTGRASGATKAGTSRSRWT